MLKRPRADDRRVRNTLWFGGIVVVVCSTLGVAGEGAYAGTLNYTRRGLEGGLDELVRRGYATASTDTGHSASDRNWAIGHPERVAALKRKGVKIIQYHGWNDQTLQPAYSPAYYDRVTKAMGGAAQTQDFYRLFMVPGMTHCYSGPGANSFGAVGQQLVPRDAAHDIQTALEMWVEKGVAPDKLIATKYIDDSPATKTVKFTRPLCPYPQVAQYTSGDKNDATSFVCVKPSSGRRRLVELEVGSRAIRSQKLLQPCVFSLGLVHCGNVRIGVLPHCEEVLPRAAWYRASMSLIRS